MPAATPYPIHRARRDTPRVAARTMLTTRAASSTSRRTMTAVASTGVSRVLLLGDDTAFGSLFVELTDKSIGTRLEWPEDESGFAPHRNDFFPFQILALEFFGRCVEVLHDELEFLSRRHGNLWRLELVIADRNRERK